MKDFSVVKFQWKKKKKKKVWILPDEPPTLRKVQRRRLLMGYGNKAEERQEAEPRSGDQRT